MTRFLAVFFVLALTRPAAADECRIIWWDLFLPQSEAEFEKTSEASATLTLKNTSKLEAMSFDLALQTLSREDGGMIDLFVGSRTMASDRVSNDVTITLQPANGKWVVGFESKQNVRTKDGRSAFGVNMLTGTLICSQLRP